MAALPAYDVEPARTRCVGAGLRVCFASTSTVLCDACWSDVEAATDPDTGDVDSARLRASGIAVPDDVRADVAALNAMLAEVR